MIVPRRICLSLRVLLLFCIFFCTFAEAGNAQSTTFNPSFRLGVFQAEDIDFGGAGQQSDVVTRVEASFPLVRQLRKGKLALVYGPYFDQYTDFSSLDNIGHRVRLDLEATPTALSKIGLRASFSKTEDQGDAGSAEEADLFLSQRTERELSTFVLDYEDSLRGKWGWRVSAGYQNSDFSPLFDADIGEEVRDFESRSTTRGSVSLVNRVSSRASVGLRYGHRRFDLNQSGEETIDEFSLVVRRQIGPASDLEFDVGGFRRSRPEVVLEEALLEDSREGFSAGVAWNRDLRTVGIRLSASHVPTAGGVLEGTSTNTYAGITIDSRTTRRFNWDIFLRYAYRDPSEADGETVESYSLGFGLEARLKQFISLRLAGNYVDQTGREAVADLNLLTRGGLSLVWYPLRGTRLAGREAEATE